MPQAAGPAVSGLSLLEGQFNEDDSSASFADALQAWRGGAASKAATTVPEAITGNHMQQRVPRGSQNVLLTYLQFSVLGTNRGPTDNQINTVICMTWGSSAHVHIDTRHDKEAAWGLDLFCCSLRLFSFVHSICQSCSAGPAHKLTLCCWRKSNLLWVVKLLMRSQIAATKMQDLTKSCMCMLFILCTEQTTQK